MADVKSQNEANRAAWDANAAFWDQRMGEGNDFVEVLIWPAVEHLLEPRVGQRILDIACGNGLTSRRLAAAGAEVLAFDFSQEMVAHARGRTHGGRGRIEYRLLDAANEQALLGLGTGQYDAALCNMALFDMAEIDPLARALARLLRSGGRFVFSILHPCFNNSRVSHLAELEDRHGEIVTTYSLRVFGYMTPTVAEAAAIAGQPKPQLYFDRPLQDTVGAFLKTGFVLDGLLERAFPPEHPQGSLGLSWGGKFSEIPPVMVVRMRLA